MGDLSIKSERKRARAEGRKKERKNGVFNFP
jgi:hypothetical protein